MIAPALDLQGALLQIDRVAPENTPAERSGGDFGAALTASLSASPSGASSGVGRDGCSTGQGGVVAARSATSGRTLASNSAGPMSKVASTSLASEQAGAGQTLLQNTLKDAGVEALQKTSSTRSANAAAKPEDAALVADKSSLAKAGAQEVAGDSRSEEDSALQAAKQAVSGVADEGKAAGKLQAETDAKSAAKAGGSSQGSAKSGSSAAKDKEAVPGAASSLALPSHGAGLASGPLIAAVHVDAQALPAQTGSASSMQVAGVASVSRTGVVKTSDPAHGQGLVSANDGAVQTLSATQRSVGGSGALAAWNSIETKGGTSAGKGSLVREGSLAADAAEAGKQSAGAFDASIAQTAGGAVGRAESSTTGDGSSAAYVPPSWMVSGEQSGPPLTGSIGDGHRLGLVGSLTVGTAKADGVSGGPSSTIAAAPGVARTAPGAVSWNAAKVARAPANASSTANHMVPATATMSTAANNPLVSGQSSVENSSDEAAQSARTQVVNGGAGSSTEHGTFTNAFSTQVAQDTRVAFDSASQRPVSEAVSASGHTKIHGSADGSQSASAEGTAAKDSADRRLSNDVSDGSASAPASALGTATAVSHSVPQETAGVVAPVSSALASQGILHAGANGTSALASSGRDASPQTSSGLAEAGASHAASGSNAGMMLEPHQTLAATPTSLEVGVHSGSQGWLKIRAELGGQGEVSASLSAASASGDQTLKGQLPALNAYLHSEQMPVTASVAERIGLAHGAAMQETGSVLQAGTSSSHGQDTSLLHGGAGQEMTGQGSGRQSESAVSSTVQSGDDAQTRYATSAARGVVSDAALKPAATVESSGQWLNVRV